MTRTLPAGCLVAMMASAAWGQATQAGGERTAVIEAYKATMKAMMAGNVEELVRRVDAPGAEDALRLMTEDQVAKHAAGKALLARFGPEGKRLITDPLTFDDQMKEASEAVGEGQVTITGDLALLSSDPASRMKIMARLRRINGVWKLDESGYAASLGKDGAARTKLREDAALMNEWTKRIQAGEFANLNEAQAGLGLLTAVAERRGGLTATRPADNRWARKAREAGLTPVQRAAYEAIAELPDCQWEQMEVPGAPAPLIPAPGTPNAGAIISLLGIEAVPELAEALDDTRDSKTRTAHANLPPWKVNALAIVLIRGICHRDFVIELGGQQHTLEEVASHPEWAPAFQAEIDKWLSAHGNQTESERKIADVQDGWFRNRLDAVEWLGRNKVKAASAAIAADIDRTLAAMASQDDSLKEDEAADCAEALGQIGAKDQLANVKNVCAMFWANWSRRHKPMSSMDIGSLFQAYHGEALLGGKAVALDELRAIQRQFQGEWEQGDREEYARRLRAAEQW